MCENKRLKADELIEGVDFFWEERKGTRMRVFTKEYLMRIKKSCCKGGCKNCPWGYEKKKKKKK